MEGGRQRSVATALAGRGRRGHHLHDAINCYPRGDRGDESPTWEAGALVVRPRGAPRERPGGGGASESGAAMQRSPTAAVVGKGRLGFLHRHAVANASKDFPPRLVQDVKVIDARVGRKSTTAAAF